MLLGLYYNIIFIFLEFSGVSCQSKLQLIPHYIQINIQKALKWKSPYYASMAFASLDLSEPKLDLNNDFQASVDN